MKQNEVFNNYKEILMEYLNGLKYNKEKFDQDEVIENFYDKYE